VAARLPSVDGCATIEEQADRVERLAAGGGAVDRADTHLVAGGDVRVRARLEQVERGIGGAEEAREVKRGEPVVRPSLREGSISAQQLGHPWMRADGRRLEDVEHRRWVSGEEGEGFLALASIQQRKQF
jgi:hypothetical protein